MKKATCQDLRGACMTVITGETPDEMGANCRRHVEEMLAAGDSDHMKAVESMKELSQDEQQAWYDEFKAGFDALEEA